MNVIPQYKVIGPYKYDRIIHNIKKIMLRDRSDKWNVRESFSFN